MLQHPSEFKRLLHLLQQPLIYLIVRRSRIEQLPQSVRGYSHHANEELMRSLSLELDPLTPEVRVFSDENSAVRHISSLQVDSNRPLFGFVASPPHLLATRLLDSKAERFVINMGLPNTISFPKDRFEQIKRLAQIVHLSIGNSIYIAENGKGTALVSEYQGQKFAIGYRSRDLTEEQERKLRESFPGATLVKNSVRQVARGLLSSDLAGLIIEFGARQQIWRQEELTWVIATHPVLSGGILGKIKKILT